VSDRSPSAEWASRSIKTDSRTTSQEPEEFSSQLVRGQELADTGRALDQAGPIRAVGGDTTMAMRVTQLEDAMHAHKVDHLDMEYGAWSHANQVAAESADLVEQRLTPELQALLSYLVGREERPAWRPWWLGPALLSVGLVLGTLGNIVSAAA
jgi:hypothetical protein